jgi:hypothetical protein
MTDEFSIFWVKEGKHPSYFAGVKKDFKTDFLRKVTLKINSKVYQEVAMWLFTEKENSNYLEAGKNGCIQGRVQKGDSIKSSCSELYWV